MKKRYMILSIVVAIAVVGLPLLLIADEELNPMTVEEAKELKDDTKVLLKGYIIEKLDKEMFLFRDNTGDIDLEIEDDVWKDRTLAPDSTVLVHGEINRDKDMVRIEVDEIADLDVEVEIEEDIIDESVY